MSKKLRYSFKEIYSAMDPLVQEKTTLSYFAICSESSSPGIYKKVTGFSKGARKFGFKSQPICINPNGIKGYMLFLKSIFQSKSQIIVYRYIPKIGSLCGVLCIFLRIKKKKVIIDIPTPMKNHIREIKLSNLHKRKVRVYLEIASIILQGCFPFLFANKLLQYSIESRYFSFFCSEKTSLIGNGIDTDFIKIRENYPKWPSSRLNLIAVGNLAIWHGWDKIISVISELRERRLISYDIYFDIVGDGPEKNKLQELTTDKGLNEFVIFHGFKYGEDLESLYKNAHFGLGSFGWERIGICVAAPIKSREYLATGLPVLYSTHDIDLSKCKESYEFSNLDLDKQLIDFFVRLPEREIPLPQACRTFAKENLDFFYLVKKIFESLK